MSIDKTALEAIAAGMKQHRQPLVDALRSHIIDLRAEAACAPNGHTFGQQAASNRAGQEADYLERLLAAQASEGEAAHQKRMAQDALRWADIAHRFDKAKTSACERFLEAIGLDPALAHRPLHEIIDSAIIRMLDATRKGLDGFSNRGDSEAQFIADSERLNCPACGGSGHVDDAALPKVNIVCETRTDAVAGSMSLNVIRVEREDDGSVTAITDHWPRESNTAHDAMKCPACSTVGTVLFECAACSYGNYPKPSAG